MSTLLFKVSTRLRALLPHTQEEQARDEPAHHNPTDPVYYAIIGRFTGKKIGVCAGAGKEEALCAAGTGKLVPITKQEFDSFGK